MSTPAEQRQDHCKKIEDARAENESILRKIDAMKSKRSDYAARAESVTAEIAATEDSKKIALRNFANGTADEKPVSAAIAKGAALEVSVRTFSEILQSIDAEIIELTEKKTATAKILGRATSDAWLALFADELEKAAPVIARLYGLHTFAQRARHGIGANISADTFKEILQNASIFRSVDNVTVSEYFVAVVGTEPLDRFWKV